MDRLDRKDLKDAPFDVVLRGYDKRQVEERIRFLGAELAAAEHALRATQARAASLEDELNQVRGGYGGLRPGPGPGGAGPGEAGPGPEASFGARVEKILRTAEEEGREVRSQAGAEAAALVEQARAEAEEHRKRAAQESAARKAEAEKLSANAAYEADQLRKNAAQEADKLRKTAAQEAEQLRKTAAQEAEDALKAARSKASQLLEQARAEADRLVSSATESAQHRERASAQELQRLARLRDQVNADLYRAKSVLDGFFPATAEASGTSSASKAAQNGVVEHDGQSSRR